MSENAHPAATHCDGCGCDWLDNGLNPVGCPYCSWAAEIEALRMEAEEWMSFAEAQVVLRAEAESYAEELERALAELISWIPSADVYRRLGFDPEAPMRALEEARALLRREDSNG